VKVEIVRLGPGGTINIEGLPPLMYACCIASPTICSVMATCDAPATAAKASPAATGRPAVTVPGATAALGLLLLSVARPSQWAKPSVVLAAGPVSLPSFLASREQKMLSMSDFRTFEASAIWCAISLPLPAASASSCDPDTVASLSDICVTLFLRTVGWDGPLLS